MKLVMLGTTGYHPNNLRDTACYLLPEVGVVLDAGTGMQRLRGNLATDELDIFLSHTHLDHVVGLTFLLGALYDKPMRRVTVHGEAEKLAAVREHLFHPTLFPVAPEFEMRPLAGPITVAGGGKVTYFPVEHPGGAVGYRIDWPSRSLAYVTDTTAGPDVGYIEQIRGVDLLLHECNFSDDVPSDFVEKTGHSQTTPVANLAKAAGVGRLVLTHLDSSINAIDPVGLATARSIFPNTELAEDGKTLEF